MWIPAIDLSNGQSVRLYQGDFDQKTLINADPLTQAQAIEQAGLTALHLVDLDGAKAGNPQNLAVIKQLVAQTNLAIELGGGIRSLEQIRQFLELGISRVIIGSAAIKQPEMVQQAVAEFGAAKVVVGVDGRHEMVATHGWLDTATVSMAELIDQMVGYGVRHFIVTDIDRDGTMQGPNVALLVKLQQQFSDAEIIASGGIRSIADLQDLRTHGIQSAVIGKALAAGGMTLAELKAVN